MKKLESAALKMNNKLMKLNLWISAENWLRPGTNLYVAVNFFEESQTFSSVTSIITLGNAK